MGAVEKSEHILDTSLAVFCRYGFAKTTMKDLADAAGISRASLYLHFSNKQDLFRAGSQRTHTRVMTEVVAALESEGPILERIEYAIAAYVQGLMAEIIESPYGNELFDSNRELSGDITQASRTRLISRISAALAAAEAAGEIDLAPVGASTESVARLILGTVEGGKGVGETTGELNDLSSLFFKILGQAVAR